MAVLNGKEGVWRTVGGRRIFIANGEDLATAMKNSGKFDNILNNKDKLGIMEKMDAIKNNLTKLKKEGKLGYDGRTAAKTQTTLDYDLIHLTYSEGDKAMDIINGKGSMNDMPKLSEYKDSVKYIEKQMTTIKNIDGVGDVKGRWEKVYVPMHGYALHYRITIKPSK